MKISDVVSADWDNVSADWDIVSVDCGRWEVGGRKRTIFIEMTAIGSDVGCG